MMPRFRLLCAALFTLYCSSVFAVGMGELDLKSSLNQRFEAEIPLDNVGTLGLDEIIANLASQDDFDRVGVERNYELVDLRFRIQANPEGDYFIHVTSSRPIIEPFLNFIVEVIWPNGRILREYTVLLDPPVFGTDGIERIQPGMSASPVEPSAPSASTSSRRRPIPPAPSVSSGRTEGVVTQDDEYGLTGPGDTLWSIATKVRPNDSVSVQQTMLALQRANPEAFINNNINLLKAGHVLRIPDVSEIRAESTEDAIAEVRIQNEEFEDYQGSEVTQLDARRTPGRQSDADADEEDDGELRLLASDQSGARSGAADDGRVAELEEALSVAQEDLDRARRANTEMNVRLDDLSGQIETLNEIVQLKDDQLAALRAEVERSMNAQQDAGSAPVVTQAPQSGGLLGNPLVLGGLGVGLLAIIGGVVFLLRRRSQAAASDEDDFLEVSIDEPAAEEEAELDIDIDEPADEEGEDEDVTQQTSDVISEAEIYIAYGRFPQAISFLQNAIENEPDRADIQLKLLEVYVQTEDATAFNLQLEQLKSLGDDAATSRALEMQQQIPGAAETAAASMDATIVSSEPIAAIEEPGDDDDDDELSFDLDDLDAETEDDDLDLSGDEVLSDTQELSLDEAMELGDADLDLDLDAALEDAAADEPEAEAEADGGDDLDLDLDLDLDDDIDLDFDDDTGDGLAETQQLDADETLDVGDDDLDGGLDLGELDTGDDDDGDDALELDLDAADDDDGLDLGELDTGDDDDDALDLSDLATDDADDDALDLGDLDTGDDDDLTLDLGDDEEISLDLDDDSDVELDLGGDDELDLGADDGGIELDLDGDDGGLELDLGDDDELNLDDDFDLGDDELNLDEDASSKLDLARAYIEMGDNDGAKSLLQEVVSEGDEGQVSEANELLSSLE